MRSWRAGAPEGAAFLCNSAYFAESDRRFRSQDIGVSHCASCTSALSTFPIARQSRRYRDTSAATTLLARVAFAAVPRSVFNGGERVVDINANVITNAEGRARSARRSRCLRPDTGPEPHVRRTEVPFRVQYSPLALACRGPRRRPQHEAARRVSFERSAPPVPPDLSESGRRRGRRPAREFEPPSAAWASTRRWCTGGARLHAQRIYSYRPRRRRHADHA